MNAIASRTIEAPDEFLAELRHADELIADQQTRIEALEAVARLQAVVEAHEVAA